MNPGSESWIWTLHVMLLASTWQKYVQMGELLPKCDSVREMTLWLYHNRPSDVRSGCGLWAQKTDVELASCNERKTKWSNACLDTSAAVGSLLDSHTITDDHLLELAVAWEYTATTSVVQSCTVPTSKLSCSCPTCFSRAATLSTFESLPIPMLL